MTRFRDLAIGDVFYFGSEYDPRFRFSGMAKGPWRKTGPRKYEHAETGLKCRVGSINVDVVRKEQST